jgi:N-acyl amino acid synthase of PEP-CTERM/exosortase system
MIAHFQTRTIDDSPRLLEKSYRLRYQVYCLERRFLPAEAYPDGLERDEFDCHSVHVGVVDPHDELAGTARLVMNSAAGLPLLRHCTLFPGETAIDDPRHRVVEASRLSVSRHYSRRQDDAFFTPPPSAPVVPAPSRGTERRDGRHDVFLMVLKALYQASKRMAATHWIVATERSLQRRGAEYGFPFRVVGPESNYAGRIEPYIMSVAEFDEVVLGGRIAALDDFLVGLESEFRPCTAWPASSESSPDGQNTKVMARRGIGS